MSIESSTIREDLEDTYRRGPGPHLISTPRQTGVPILEFKVRDQICRPGNLDFDELKRRERGHEDSGETEG